MIDKSTCQKIQQVVMQAKLKLKMNVNLWHRAFNAKGKHKYTMWQTRKRSIKFDVEVLDLSYTPGDVLSFQEDD